MMTFDMNALDHAHHSPFDPKADCLRCKMDTARRAQEENDRRIDIQLRIDEGDQNGRC